MDIVADSTTDGETRDASHAVSILSTSLTAVGAGGTDAKIVEVKSRETCGASNWSYVAAAVLAASNQKVAVDAGRTAEDLVSESIALADSIDESEGWLAYEARKVVRATHTG